MAKDVLVTGSGTLGGFGAWGNLGMPSAPHLHPATTWSGVGELLSTSTEHPVGGWMWQNNYGAIGVDTNGTQGGPPLPDNSLACPRTVKQVPQCFTVAAFPRGGGGRQQLQRSAIWRLQDTHEVELGRTHFSFLRSV